MNAQALASWREEKRSAYLYRLVSDAESGTPRQVLFLELARAADEQAGIWLEEIRKSGSDAPAAYKPDLRARLVGWLIGRFGVAPLKGVLAAMKGLYPPDELARTTAGTSCDRIVRLEVPFVEAERHLVLCRPASAE